MTLGKTPRDRLSQQYIDGVNSFLTFAMTVVDRSGKIMCPCIDWLTNTFIDVETSRLQLGWVRRCVISIFQKLIILLAIIN